MCRITEFQIGMLVTRSKLHGTSNLPITEGQIIHLCKLMIALLSKTDFHQIQINTAKLTFPAVKLYYCQKLGCLIEESSTSFKYAATTSVLQCEY